jgi:hypothetical protein
VPRPLNLVVRRLTPNSFLLWAWALLGAPGTFAVVGRYVSLRYMTTLDAPSDGPPLLALFAACFGSGAIALLLVKYRRSDTWKKAVAAFVYVIVAGLVGNFVRGMLVMSGLHL